MSTQAPDVVRRPVVLPRSGALHAVPVTVLVVALLAAVARLPYLRAPISSDEGGFLVLARQWRAGGGSLYGPYWVDRPPLLVAFFKVAASLGGITPLRVLGCVVVALTVVGVGLAAAQLAETPRGSRRTALAASVVAGVLLADPTGGAVMVNGEMVAAVPIAYGIALTLMALRGRTWSDWAAVGAGVCATAAVMVKQNMVDVVVFALALGVAAGVRRHLPAARLWRLLGLASAGAGSALGAVLLLCRILGTSPWGVLYAMYPFRVRAMELMHHDQTSQAERLLKMTEMWAVTGAPLIICAAVCVLLLRRRMPPILMGGPVVVALAVLTAYDVVSVVLGGSYWSHYVLQLVVPLALTAGLLAGQVRRVGVALVAVVVACCAIGWVSGLTARVYAAGPVIGDAVEDAALPGDTMLSLFGDGAMVETARLPAPYPYLWSLPAHVLDPRFERLSVALDGPNAPSWLVVRNDRTLQQLEDRASGPALRHRYRRVATLCEHPVFLRRDLTRLTPTAESGCSLPLVPWNHDDATHRWSVT